MKVRELSLPRRQLKKGWAGAQSRYSSQRDSWENVKMKVWLYPFRLCCQSFAQVNIPFPTLLRDPEVWREKRGGDQSQLKGP